MVTSTVSRDQRHTKRNRCPICGGADGDPRGKGRRCHGFTSADGYAHCSREEHAGGLQLEGKADTYAHKLGGPCKCGTVHRDDERDWQGIEAAYDYRDERGTLLCQVVRKPGPPKKFVQRTPDGAGGWQWSASGVRNVPYRLPEVLEAPLDAFVFVVEGEKDVDRLRSLGAHATCNRMGAGKWGLVDPVTRARVVDERNIVVIADADQDGRDHAEQVAADISERVATLRVFSLYPDNSKRDVSDWLDEGHTLEELLAIVEGVEPRAVNAVDPWRRELEQALADVKERLGARTGQRAPLFGVDIVDLQQKVFPPAQWLVTGLLTRGGTGMVAGEPKAGIKTWALVEIAVAIASGTKAFGEFFTERGRVAVFFAEDHEQSIRNRSRATMKGRTIPRGAFTLQPRGEFIDVLKDEDLAWVVASARRLGKLDLLVLDPLRDIHSGEEDKSDSMRDVMRRLRLLGELLGCTVLVSHHTVKVTKDSDKRSTWQNIRGSSAIRGSLDAGLMVNALKGGGPNAFKVAVDSMVKSARPAGSFVLDLAIDDDEGGEATAANWTFSRPSGPADSAIEKDCKVAWEFVRKLAMRGEVLSRRALRDHDEAPLPEKRMRQALDLLVGQERLGQHRLVLDGTKVVLPHQSPTENR